MMHTLIFFFFLHEIDLRNKLSIGSENVLNDSDYDFK